MTDKITDIADIWRNRIIGYGEASPEQLVANPRNPRIHPAAQQSALKGGLDEIGWIQNIIVNQRTGFVVDGHARIMLALRHGVKFVPITYVDLTEAEEALALATLDPISAMAGTDAALMDDLIRDIETENEDVLAFLESQMRDGGSSSDAADAIAELAGAEAVISPRILPIDAVYTLTPTDPSCFVAHAAGFGIGTRTTDSRLMGDHRSKWSWAFPITFLDNDYHDYDHAKHVDVVAEIKPKYATTRDIMSQQQCDDAGIPYFSFDEIMRFVEDIQPHVEHVIVIPKTDCLHEIPTHHVLGYSVPTSYGGTPLPAATFRGRRVHLLGGSWKNQLKYLSILRDDVVSLDFNHINHIAQWGGFVYPDGSRESGRLIQSLGLSVTNARQVCLAISLGHIGRAINDMFAGDNPMPEDVIEEPPPDEETGD
jgi:hypothetical protein